MSSLTATSTSEQERGKERTEQEQEHKAERTYHNFPGSKYILPADEEERERLRFQHQLIRAYDEGKLLFVPYVPQEGDTILDIGTGTGVWLLELIQTFLPNVSLSLTGIDISDRLFPSTISSPTLSTLSTTHPGIACTFTQQSILSLPSQWRSTFTLIHQRLLLAAFRASEWPLAIRAIYDALKPGGYVQLTEVLGLEGGEKTKRVQLMKEELFDRVGLLHDCVKRIPGMLREVGFEPIGGNGSGSGTPSEFEFEFAVIDRHFPLSPHSPPNSIPYLAAKSFSRFHRSLKDTFVQQGWRKDSEEIDEMIDEMEKEWEESGAGNYNAEECVMRMVTFVGKKPL
jgi:SAM-dependent methyltransferase